MSEQEKSYHHGLSDEKKQERVDRAKSWNERNKERVRRNQRLWYEKRKAAGIKQKPKDRKKNIEAQRRHKAKYPWYYSMAAAKQRCTNPKSPHYHRYGGRGIKFNLTHADLRFLWTRDKADQMDHPSIDRKDNDGDYTLENCQFIEWRDNARKVRLDSLKRKHGRSHFIDDLLK